MYALTMEEQGQNAIFENGVDGIAYEPGIRLPSGTVIKPPAPRGTFPLSPGARWVRRVVIYCSWYEDDDAGS